MIHFSCLFRYSLRENIKATLELIKLKLTRKKFIDITADDLLSKLESGVPLTIIDCRQKKVFDDIGHIKDAESHPVFSFEETCHSIPKDRQVAVVCYFGYFCQIASQQLADMGHKNVLSMKGGMEDWIMSDKPITKTT